MCAVGPAGGWSIGRARGSLAPRRGLGGRGFRAPIAAPEDARDGRAVLVADTTVGDMNWGDAGGAKAACDDDSCDVLSAPPLSAALFTVSSLALCASGVSVGSSASAIAFASASADALASASSILKLDRVICPSTFIRRALARSALVLARSVSSARLAAASASASIAR